MSRQVSAWRRFCASIQALLWVCVALLCIPLLAVIGVMAVPAILGIVVVFVIVALIHDTFFSE